MSEDVSTPLYDQPGSSSTPDVKDIGVPPPSRTLPYPDFLDLRSGSLGRPNRVHYPVDRTVSGHTRHPPPVPSRVLVSDLEEGQSSLTLQISKTPFMNLFLISYRPRQYSQGGHDDVSRVGSLPRTTQVRRGQPQNLKCY